MSKVKSAAIWLKNVLVKFVKGEPLVFWFGLLTVVATIVGYATGNHTWHEDGAYALPLILAFIGRWVTAPWAEIKPLVDAAAKAIGGADPGAKHYTDILQQAIDTAAAAAPPKA